eukprot:2660313-Rhodomonas_salina.2
MPRPNSSVAHYAVLDHSSPGHDEDLGHLMQSIALDLWKLKKPKVLISVTGGATEFAMSRVDNDKIMQVTLWVGLAA